LAALLSAAEKKLLRGCFAVPSFFAACVLVMLTIRFSLTRLETRTKESNIYASIWVAKTLVRNESNFGRTPLLRPHYRPIA